MATTRCLQDVAVMSAVMENLFDISLPPSPTSEDCLYLNVYTPAHAREGSSLPVSDNPKSLGGWDDGKEERREGHELWQEN